MTWSTNFSTRASSTITATSMLFVEYAQTGLEDQADSNQREQSQGSTWKSESTSSRRYGFATTGHGGLRHTQAVHKTDLRPEREPGDCGLPHLDLGDLGIPNTAREMSLCCSRRTRRTARRLFGTPNDSPYVKDGINNYVVQGNPDTVSPEKLDGCRTRRALPVKRGRGNTATIRLRLS